jgi:alpha-galactosidase
VTELAQRPAPSGLGDRRVWTLVGAATEYTVVLPEHGRWLELAAWGPHGVSEGESPLAFHGRVQYLTDGDVAAVEYTPDGLRPFAGADLVVDAADGSRSLCWQFQNATLHAGALRVTFVDDVTGLLALLCYRLAPDTDVIERWVELTNTGSAALRLVAVGSAGFNVPTPHGARLTHLSGQWAQEFTPAVTDLTRGGFAIGSAQGVTGHQHSPYLAVADRLDATRCWGVGLAWSGSWQILAERDATGLTRVRAGRALVDGPVTLAPGMSLTTPVAVGAYSDGGVDGLARAWHRYERTLAADRLHQTRRVIYNSWEATGFDVDAASQLELARTAAQLGVETFVVDDGWFVGRGDDHGGLGDWTPDPAKFPNGLASFVDAVRALGLTFGLWAEPEMVNPRSALYAEHPEWVYRVNGRPMTTIRNQLLLDLGRADVAEFVHRTLDGLLSQYDIGYLKWDFNRPRTEPGRPGVPRDRLDLDGAHVANLYRILETIRRDHPGVTIEGCAAGGARVDLALAARVDVLWPSDNTAPIDRLRVQHGFLHAHAPHLMSSWVTDAPGMFDDRPRSLAFRFVLACSGVLGIGADITRWSADQRAEAAAWIARYKDVRNVITRGEVHQIGGPDESRCAVQYTLDDQIVVLAWNTGPLDGTGVVPGRAVRLPLRGLDSATRYRHAGAVYSGSHLTAVGLPVYWTRGHDAEMVVLRAEGAR